jgi:hypothetical protein
MPRGGSPARARVIRAWLTARAARLRAGSASGSHVVSWRSPRARYAASAPSTSSTVAPTLRTGPRAALVSMAASGGLGDVRDGHGSIDP